ncbi:cold-shock protein [Phycisphaerales bacterium AB-hyl4]|uniref:Cold-shock protein n=1 Tax=Natronomicrosphaera hydrolytica TaxID=3242702 RepID=A0ABV4U4L6_9BACT
MAEGKIKKLTDRGFGFIQTESGQEIFFHANSLQDARFEDLQEGQRVTFDEQRSEKGPQAENVTLA